jgi:hypothetical protein
MKCGALNWLGEQMNSVHSFCSVIFLYIVIVFNVFMNRNGMCCLELELSIVDFCISSSRCYLLHGAQIMEVYKIGSVLKLVGISFFDNDSVINEMMPT